jgi:hypothetical protein
MSDSIPWGAEATSWVIARRTKKPSTCPLTPTPCEQIYLKEKPAIKYGVSVLNQYICQGNYSNTLWYGYWKRRCTTHTAYNKHINYIAIRITEKNTHTDRDGGKYVSLPDIRECSQRLRRLQPGKSCTCTTGQWQRTVSVNVVIPSKYMYINWKCAI